MGGIAEAEKSEHNGSFLLTWRTHRSITSGDLGRGSAEKIARFLTEEGRTYFMQAEALREKCAQLANELYEANRQLREIKERRERRRKQRLKRLLAR